MKWELFKSFAISIYYSLWENYWTSEILARIYLEKKNALILLKRYFWCRTAASLQNHSSPPPIQYQVPSSSTTYRFLKLECNILNKMIICSEYLKWKQYYLSFKGSSLFDLLFIALLPTLETTFKALISATVCLL